jgi:DNA mismatch repair protein MutS2
MKSLNTDAMNALEFARVLEAAARYARSGPSRDGVMALGPMDALPALRERYGAIAELRRMADSGEPLTLDAFEDIGPAIKSLTPPGAVLDGMDLLVFIPVLENLDAISTAAARMDESGALAALSAGVTGMPAIRQALERSLDADGGVRDSASVELAGLRSQIRALERRIERKLEEIMADPRVQPFLQDSFTTKRSGRWVVPVRMDAKGQVRGVVHDVSRTGETAFMEPLEVIGLTAELENLTADARAEELRILRSLTARLREAVPEIVPQFSALVHLDVLRSLTAFGARHGFQIPEVAEGGPLRIVGARHPLLVMMGGPRVVPLDLEFGPDDPVMLVTGPNAGGKTVALKTVGLVTLMARSGIPVPADSSTLVPLEGGVLVDIGDDQSVERHMSTFAAHVAKTAAILAGAGPGTLVLLDELGTGTDPAEGAAIGAAVLAALHRAGARVAATTHLVDIVAFVHRQAGMRNASMEFDRATMRPLYRLTMGEPGQSHALDVARQYGLPGPVLEHARELLGTERAELQELLAELKEARSSHEAALAGAEAARRAAERDRAAAEARLKEIEAGRARAMKDALTEARYEARSMVAEIRSVLDEARRSKGRETLRQAKALQAEVEDRLRQFEEPSGEPIALEEIVEGDRVHVNSFNLDATVLSVDRGRARVRLKAGDKELELPAAALSAPRGIAEVRPEPARPVGRVAASAAEPEPHGAGMEIKLIGLRVDEALDRLEPFLSEAQRAGLASVTVIHGKGTGALRAGVREFLSGHPLVAEFGSAPEPSGDGATVVILK